MNKLSGILKFRGPYIYLLDFLDYMSNRNTFAVL